MNGETNTDGQAAELQNLRRQIAELREAENERRRVEEKLLEAEERLRNALKSVEDEKAKFEAIIDAIGDGITIQDRDYKILYQNKACIHAIGKHVGEYCYMAYEGVEHTCEECPVSKSFMDGGVHTVVRSVLTERGIRYFENTASALKDSEGKILAGIEVVRDITERKRMEDALKESARHLKLIIETAPQCIKLVAADGTILEMNPAGLAMIEAGSLDQVRDRSIYSVLAPEHQETFSAHVEKTFKGEAGSLEFEIIGMKGTHRWLSMQSVPFRDAKGDITALLGITDDITENRKLRHQFFQSQKMEAVGQLAAGIAHDFNNILTAIIGYGHVLKVRTAGDGPMMVNIEHILEAAERAASLTRDLLAFSRKQIINVRPADLNDIVKKVERLLLRTIGEDIEVVTRTSEETLTVNVDSAQMEQVLLNLATNARDAMPQGGVLSVETAFSSMDDKFIKAHGFGSPGKYALISVSDTGIGMDKTIIDKIFEPFFTTKDVGKGTGLGLSMVYGTVRQHNGFITVYSEPGTGTTFRIYLPLVSPKVAKEQEAPLPAVLSGPETILVAEDDPVLRELNSELLADYGYNVIAAEDGEDAINKFMENKDKIVMCLFDVIMPKKSGREAYETIKNSSPGVKVLFASGYAADRTHMEELSGAGINFIRKPYSPVALLKKVREILDSDRNE